MPVHDACTAAAVLVCPLGEDAVHLQRTHLYIGHVLAGMWHGPYWTQICWLAHVVAIQDAYANGHVPGTCPRPPRAQLPFLTAARRWWGGGGMAMFSMPSMHTRAWFNLLCRAVGCVTKVCHVLAAALAAGSYP